MGNDYTVIFVPLTIELLMIYKKSFYASLIKHKLNPYGMFLFALPTHQYILDVSGHFVLRWVIRLNCSNILLKNMVRARIIP